MSSRRGVSGGALIRIRRDIRRAWPAAVLATALFAMTALRVEASIVTAGQAFVSGFPLGLSDPDNATVSNFIGVGQNGAGSLTVDGGSVLTLTPNAFGAGINVGGNQGTTTGQGSVWIDGPGSRIDITGLGAFINVGRWGALSTGSLGITNGGVLTSTFLSVGLGDTTLVDLTQGATGTVSVSGTGSAIYLGGTDAAGNAPGGSIGRAGGSGSVTLANGAVMTMDGAAAILNGPGFTVGREAGSEGSFTIETLASMTINANAKGGGFTLGGNSGSTGTLTVQGAGTLTIVSSLGGGGFTIGNSGTGTLTVTGAGSAVLQDGQATTATPGITVGSNAGGVGTLNIQDGAMLTINRSSAGCCMTVGRLGSGSLNITGGGKLIISDTSTTGGGIAFGGNNTSRQDPNDPNSPLVGGPFSVLLSGAGSELTMNSSVDGGMSVGRNAGSSGTMTITGGATLNIDVFAVAVNTGSSATLNVSGAGTAVNMVGDAGGTVGAGFFLGGSGAGIMNVTGGAQVNIDGATTSDPSGFNVGGSRTAGAGGTGTLNVSGPGSKISVMGSTVTFHVGNDNTGGSTPTVGTMTIASGAQVLLDTNGRGSIAPTPGSTGTVVVTGAGSVLDSGEFLGIGQDRNDNAGGTGTLTLSNGGVVRAVQIHCGAGGTINGDGGIIVGDVIADPSCVISPGASPGRLSIIGSFTSIGGKIVLEVDANGNHDVLAVEGTTSFDSTTQVEVRVDPAFQPSGGTTLQMIQVQADPQSQTEPLLTLTVPESGSPTVEAQGDLTSLSQPPVVVPAVDIPPSVLAVRIDIKPGNTDNTINLGSSGAIPVAILSSPAFDALTVDPLTIRLDGAAVKLVGKGERPLCSAVDVDGDGRMDLVCHILTSGLAAQGDGVAILTATTSGIAIQGADFIRIVP